jgi:hypothetical protein
MPAVPEPAVPDGPSGLAYGCLTHVEAAVDYPAFVESVLLGAAQVESGLNLCDLAPEWEPHHPLLGGLAGTFAWKNHVVARHPEATHIGLCQYRKFVSHRRLSRRVAKSYSSMDLVSPRELTRLRLDEAMRPPSDWLLAPPFHFSRLRKAGSYLAQYGRAHQVEDLLRFTAEAVEQQVLDRAEAVAFLAEDTLLPGGIELGVFPAAFWIENVTAIENVVRVCVRRFPIAHRGYDARAWAFCVERLGSYLVLRHLRRLPGFEARLLGARLASPAHWSRRFVGHLNLVTDADDYVISA